MEAILKSTSKKVPCKPKMMRKMILEMTFEEKFMSHQPSAKELYHVL